jgi:Fe-S cluster assembly protein SufD
MVQEQTLKDRILDEFGRQDPAGRDEAIGLAGFRKSALESFKQKGFPGRKQEEYRYLNFEPSLQPVFSLNGLPKGLVKTELPSWDADCYRIAVINGGFEPAFSRLDDLPAGITIGSLREALENKNIHALSSIGTLASNADDPFFALNSALFNNGAFIHIAPGMILDKPLHLLILNQGDASLFTQPRILVLAGANSESTIIQSFVTDGMPASFTNCLSEMQVGENARLTLYAIQAEQDEQSQVNSTEVHLQKNSIFKTVNFTLGGKLVRNNLNVVLDSADCEAHLYGYYHPDTGQTFDNHTLADHRHPRCNSNELYKGVISGSGTAVFNGKVYVRKDAQKTNAFQSNKNILLSDEATVNTKPQLEIYADDVKCSHGSSTGYLDPEQLFYLRSRGISMEKARSLLLKAYAGEILEQIDLLPLRDWLEQKIESKQS